MKNYEVRYKNSEGELINEIQSIEEKLFLKMTDAERLSIELKRQMKTS